ncbi:DNA repair protein RecO [Acinetobacter rathckeae]|uniref:DNA repair protein RecO n=1 Tax=Acinetobacter rathckeae TaxID=2605272 RepID=UPI0018A280C2|nr:DNA repair protein RecO C-terminal domain-containing protein [Acinetobacter rathckeae]MBF7687286.1 DNA repair protein RecO C-terminal domain-containing protein [Acinetobacter rathckeae]MBF7694361.1 DNA repair protein RecO C-terminal domain-containing protein [Acinetobacter rathckeae]
MRNQCLHGYVIHARKYRERSHIIHFFSQEYGRIDGVIRQALPPLFQPMVLYASGKSELKNFTHLEIDQHPIFLRGEAYFCGFYLNELLLKLCPLEDDLIELYQQYHLTIEALQYLHENSQDTRYLRQSLRQFEYVLLKELGYDIDFSVDALGKPLLEQQYYQFFIDQGFVESKLNTSFQGKDLLSLLSFPTIPLTDVQLVILGHLYRQMISHLLGDRPLKSRQLWLQYYQNQR